MKVLVGVPQAVSVAEFKRATHFDADDASNDLLIASYLVAAQSVIEAATRRPMLPRAVEIQCRAVGWARWWFPVCPVAEVTGIAVQQADGSWQDLAVTGVRLEMPGDEPQLVFPSGYWDAAADGAAVRITATVGAATMPMQQSQAVILLANDWFQQGIAIEAITPEQAIFGVQRLIKQVRYLRPQEFAAV